MDALITSFRRGRRTISGNQMILKVSGVDSKGKAASLVGKAASWKSPAGKEIKGKVVDWVLTTASVQNLVLQGVTKSAMKPGELL